MNATDREEPELLIENWLENLPILPVVSLIGLLAGTPVKAESSSLEDSHLHFGLAKDASVILGQESPISTSGTKGSFSHQKHRSQDQRQQGQSVPTSIDLDFNLASLPTSPHGKTTSPSEAKSQVYSMAQAQAPPSVIDLDLLFQGGSFSLVAKAVGAAEGTRTPDGGRTWAYYGHRDPGNGVWNLGSFSYQHGADSPAEADVKQLRRLTGQARR
ncbi:hypothetical protein BST81_07950, partial [Leptolyngbya sp. 'hensonii']